MNNYVYLYNNKLYLNITNRCSNKCQFCIRNNRKGVQDSNLWLEKEPDFDDMVNALKDYDLSKYKEVTFCGFGEPVYNLDVLIKTAKYIKQYGCKIKLNTNGQGNLINNKNIVPMLKGVIDTISISLNSSNSENYQAICNSKYKNAYEEILNFAKECKKYIPNIVMSKVDEGDKEENNACQKICDEIGVEFRLREKV